MLLDKARNDLQICIQSMNRPFLILPHEAAVSLDICTQDGRELAIKFPYRHVVFPPGHIGNTEDELKISWLWMGLNWPAVV
jgi:hypothetical protein